MVLCGRVVSSFRVWFEWLSCVLMVVRRLV